MSVWIAELETWDELVDDVHVYEAKPGTATRDHEPMQLPPPRRGARCRCD